MPANGCVPPVAGHGAGFERGPATRKRGDMSHLTRKDLKRDEVREGMFTAVEWLGAHGRNILIGAGVALALVVVAVLVSSVVRNRGERAQEQLAEALRVYTAPVNSAGADPDHETNPSFASEEDRRARARELFVAAHERYGSTTPGRIAGVYLGEIAAREGDLVRARQLWEGFLTKEDRNAMAATVRLNLLSLDRQENGMAAAEEALRQALEDGSPVPTDVLLYELGVTLEAAGKTEDARETFQRLVDEHPTSALASEARGRLG
jgi:tetratricopeptide (TPR) repeat protein